MIFCFFACIFCLGTGYYLGNIFPKWGLLSLRELFFLKRHSEKKEFLSDTEDFCQASLPLEELEPLLPPASVSFELSSFFDTLPLLVWAKNSKHVTVYKNKSYESFENQILLKERLEAPIFPASQENPLIEKLKRTGGAYRGRLSRSVGGQNFVFEASGLTDQEGNTWIFAFDLSEYERERDSLKKAFKQFDAAFDHFPLGIAIWSKRQRLQKFNSRFARFFQLDEENLTRHPLLEEVLEELRQKRMLPEVIDFAEYKKSFQSFFQGARRPREEIIHLPDERSVRFLATAYPDGGLLWLFEDLTDALSLKRKHHALVSVSNAVSHHIKEGILILSIDRSVLLMNAICAEWWNLDPSDVLERGFVDILEACRSHFYYHHRFSEYKNYLLNSILKRSPCKELIYRKDGVLLYFQYIPLPTGEHMLKFLDVTETHKLKEVLYESRRLLLVDQYLFLRKVQEFKKQLLEEREDLYALPALSYANGGKLLEKLRYTQFFLGEDRPMVRERLAFDPVFADLLMLFDPMIREKNLSITLNVFPDFYLTANKNLLTRFLSRLMGICFHEALPRTNFSIVVRCHQERVILSMSLTVQRRKTWDKSWYHPWDIGMPLLKEMASLAGGILSVKTSHPGRLRIQCVFMECVKQPGYLPSCNVIPFYKTA